MRTEITLHSVPEEKPGYILILFYLAFIYGLFWIIDECLVYFFSDITNAVLIKILNKVVWIGLMFFNYLIVKHFLYLIKKQRKRPVIYPVLNISKEGIAYYPENKKAIWVDISEIQIIDSILSVTVDFDSGKDFKLNLFNTDLQKQMKQDDFEKLLEYYYKKEIYIYHTPSSCGCGC
ncbi:hypothetical protein [Chryseobacterium viscerum]|uniref:hypothetical protein n=1 Tax=Chryseobacterium viscerum TaxID=1037377 RepID=UPI002221C779|nr:hypothetical protein [Chryseobacterium viscerum]MCW1960853.1 hypothetical protein [Chryseobacterium viscerum]